MNGFVAYPSVPRVNSSRSLSPSLSVSGSETSVPVSHRSMASLRPSPSVSTIVGLLTVGDPSIASGSQSRSESRETGSVR